MSDYKERSNLLQKQRLLRRLRLLAMTVLPLISTYYVLLNLSSSSLCLTVFTTNDSVQPPTLALAPATSVDHALRHSGRLLSASVSLSVSLVYLAADHHRQQGGPHTGRSDTGKLSCCRKYLAATEVSALIAAMPPIAKERYFHAA